MEKAQTNFDEWCLLNKNAHIKSTYLKKALFYKYIKSNYSPVAIANCSVVSR